MRKTTFRDQVIELIATHPNDTFTVPDIEKQMTGKVNIQSLRVLISKTLKNRGLVKKVGQKGLMSIYEITKKGRNVSQGPSKVKKKDSGTRRKTEKPGEFVNLVQIGQAVVMTISDLRKRIHELSEAYSNLQSDYNKEVAAHKLAVKELNKKNIELLNDIKVVRDANRKLRDKLEEGGHTFKVEELFHTGISNK